jgi:hypothetical protein
MKTVRLILAIIAVVLSSYGLLVGTPEAIMPYLMFLISIMMLVIGLEEFIRQRNAYGWLFVVIFLFSLYVSIQSLFIN